jgi:oxamate amidohydrolase
LWATSAMVATSHGLASSSGAAVLRRGGSAVDALIAANAVLCVAYPHMAGLGGDGFWLIGKRGQSRVEALNASGPAAAMATPAFYADHGMGDEIPSRGAAAAVTVPGAVDGWRVAHERYGKLDWAELFDDAIAYAEHGIPVARSLQDWTAQDVPVLSQYPATAEVFLPGGRAPRTGELLRQAQLAATLRTVAGEGGRALYDGSLAERLCSTLADGGSPLRPDDLAAYGANWVEPITTQYRGHTVVEFPPNTQGFAALQILGMLEQYDVTGWGDNSVAYLHHAAEIVKLAFADRNAWLTDPEAVDIPLDRLLDPGYLADRARLVDPEVAMEMSEVEPGIPYEASAARVSPTGDTCAFCAVDADGLVVSAIQSIYHDFGSAVLGGDTGVIMQNRGSFFSLDPDHPNVLAPGKRTFHTLIPGMVLRDGEPVLAFGSMGGEGQPQTHAALLSRLYDFGYDVQQAIEAPRWLMGRTWGTTSQDLSLEGRFGDEVVNELTRRGQPVKLLGDWDDNMGHAQAIRLWPDRLEGGADPRGDGAAAGH